MKKINLVQIILAVIIFAVGITTGYLYQKSQTPKFPTRGQMNQRKLPNRPNMGEVISFDDKSVTIKTVEGSSRIIIISNSTTYTQTTPADKNLLKVGSQISIIGTDNSDGSVTAQTIQFK